MNATDSVQIHSIKRTNGIAGQVQYTASVQYPDEERSSVSFVGSVYGGPVVMVTPAGVQVFVTDPGRFGDFGPEWVRRFITDAR
jgi:hypothetical protein